MKFREGRRGSKERIAPESSALGSWASNGRRRREMGVEERNYRKRGRGVDSDRQAVFLNLI